MKAVSAVAAIALASTASAANVPSKIQDRSTGSSSGASMPVVTTRGNAFYAGNERFYIRGVDYQPGGSSGAPGSLGASDPLADPSVCKRDIPYFKEMGLNTVRVYTVDNTANHDECMDALAEAGIYLVLDVNTPLYSLSRTSPSTSYNPTYLQSIFATIDAFAGYNNTLLFFSGNEVINAPNTTPTAPYIKAVTRDMKQYIGERGYRSIPVGYSAADVSQNQYLMAQYMDCGEEQTRSDFYAINNYEWCDPSSYTTSGWSNLVEMYKNYSIPLFMSEYGCITNTRTFQETGALYQPDMTGVNSGGLAYQYSEEGSGYGIVKISGNKVTPIGSQLQDLKRELAANPPPKGNGGAHGSTAPQECPGPSKNWNIKPFHGSQLPAMPSGAVQYLSKGAGKGPGLNGGGSQQAGGGSSAVASAGAGSVTSTMGSGPTGGLTVNGASSGNSASSSPSAAGRALAPADFRAAFVCGAVVVASMAFGAFAL